MSIAARERLGKIWSASNGIGLFDDITCLEENLMNRKNSVFVASAAFAATTGMAFAGSQTFDLTGIVSYDSPGEALNHLINFDVGAGSEVVGISWDNVVGNGLGGPSWGNEMTMGLQDDTTTMVTLGFFPAEGSASAGGIWGPATGGSASNLTDNGLQFTSATGNANLEFFEAYDDASGTADAQYDSGTVTIYWNEVPAPGALALLGLAGLAGTRRRRA
jgi:MYXO-CTERM domain-containing protein